jgi:murein DD-endopeptidase MepM/ murein hydrolase activator NlpD
MKTRFCFIGLLLMITAGSGFTEDVIHTIQKGETIYSLSRTYGASVQDILTLNGIDDAARIYVGQRIKIPGPKTAPATTYVEHKVVKGEALYGISRLYGTTVDALRAANNMAEDHVLKAGEVLRVPATTVAAAGTTASPGTGTTATGTGSSVVRSTAVSTVDTSLSWPVAAKEVMYMTGKLYGVVLVGERSESVKSLTQGTVVSAGPYRGFGKVAIVQMTGGYLYVYGGCESLLVKEGDRVTPGTEIGRLGIDAVSEKPELFFMVYRSNTPIDPAKAPRA